MVIRFLGDFTNRRTSACRTLVKIRIRIESATDCLIQTKSVLSILFRGRFAGLGSVDKIPSQANLSNIGELGFKIVFKNLRLASGLTAFFSLSWSIMFTSSCEIGQMRLLAGPMRKSQNVGGSYFRFARTRTSRLPFLPRVS